jgi:hypothetical protein
MSQTKWKGILPLPLREGVGGGVAPAQRKVAA